jgi:DNA repair protein RadC
MTRESYADYDRGDLILDDASQKQYVLRLRDLPAEDKPREKLMAYGPSGLSTAELFAIILNVGTKKEDVLAMSRRLLKEYGESIILDQKDPKLLAGLLGIPVSKACQVIACFELGKRFFGMPGRGKPIVIRTPSQVYEYLKDMRDLPKEHLRGLYLDSHYQLLHDEVISIGSLTSNVVHPREVFRPALEHMASAVILAHNHPSDIAKPSDADIAITKQIIDAGKILGIMLLDHVIIAKSSFSSVPGEY